MPTRVLALVAPLRSRPFRRLFVAALLSDVGDWAARLALAVLVYTRTGSATLTGLVTAVGLVCWLGPGQLLAAALDRLPRRRLLVGADLVRAVLIALAALPVPLVVVFAAVLLHGLATPPFDSARAAVRPQLVEPAQVVAATTVSALGQDISVLVGMLVGGVLLATFGADGALWVDAASFLVSAWLVRAIPANLTGGQRPTHQQLRAGGQQIVRRPPVRRAVLLVVVTMGAESAAAAMLAPYGLSVLHVGGGTIALFAALSAAVPLILTPVIAPCEPATDLQLRRLALLALVGGVATLGFCFSPHLPLLFLPLLGVGAFPVGMAIASGVVAPLVADDVRAPTFALLGGALTAGQALGALLAGALAGLIGPGPAVGLMAMPAVIVSAVCLLRPIQQVIVLEPEQHPYAGTIVLPAPAADDLALETA